MSKRALIFLVVAVVAVGFAAVAIASSVGGSSDEPATHTMQNGQTMEGKSMNSGSSGGMPSTQHQMPNGQEMGGSGGSTMPNSTPGMDMGQ